MVRILLCGDVRGCLPQVCSAVDVLQKKLPEEQKFKAVFCVGEFSSEEMDLDVKPTVPIYFVDCGPACQDLIDESPQGEEISPNLHFLGHFGVTTVAGLKVAFLSGRQRADLFDKDQGEDEDDDSRNQELPAVENLMAKYGTQDDGDRDLHVSSFSGSSGTASSSGPSWEQLKAKEKEKEELNSHLFIDGCYTPLAIERLQEEIADSGGIDLLLTSEWPKGVMSGLKDAWPEEASARRLAKSAAKQVSAVPVGEIAAHAEPKYHAVGLGGVFWRRAPWLHENRGEVVSSTGLLRCGVCRMVTLGAVDGSRPGVKDIPSSNNYSYRKPEEDEGTPKPQKWLHGLDLDPQATPATADDATPNPWTAKPAVVSTYDQVPERADFSGMDKEEQRRWMKRFGVRPSEMQGAADKLAKDLAPKEKKEKHKSLYKVSEKEKKRRKTGGDGHMPFAAKERMQAGRGG